MKRPSNQERAILDTIDEILRDRGYENGWQVTTRELTRDELRELSSNLMFLDIDTMAGGAWMIDSKASDKAQVKISEAMFSESKEAKEDAMDLLFDCCIDYYKNRINELLGERMETVKSDFYDECGIRFGIDFNHGDVIQFRRRA